jgi:PAS domain S-box-containing protein
MARKPSSSDTAGAARTGGKRRFALRPLRERGIAAHPRKLHDTRSGQKSSARTPPAPVEPAPGSVPVLPVWLRLGYYGLALLFVAAAALLRWQLSEVLTLTPFLVFYLALVGAAAFGGLGPGLLATVVSWLCIDYLFDPTGSHIGLDDPMSAARLLVFLSGGLIVSVVGEKMRRSRTREHQQGRELGVANTELQTQAAELLSANQELHEREQALRESEERLRLSLYSADAGMWDWDLSTNRNVWSEEIWRLYGLPPHCCEPSYDLWRDTVHPDDRAMTERAVREAARSGTEMRFEYRVQEAGGEVRWLMCRARPSFDADGKAVRYTGIVIDVTDRKRAEEELRLSEEKYRRIVETATEGIAMADAEARIIFVNDRWSEIFGYSPAEAARLTVFDIVFPEDVSRMKERWESRKGGQRERYEGRFRRKDGRPIWVLSSVAPRFGPAGEFLGTLVLNTDITERKQAEEALKVKDSAIASSLNAIAMADLQGRLAYINPAFLALWGYEDEREVLGKSVLDFWAEPRRALEVVQAIQTGEGWTGELVALRKDGERRHLHLAANTVFNDQGAPICMMASFVDITERKRVEESLRELTATLESKVAQRTAELERRARQLQKLTLELSEAEERERQRLAEILHDDLQQVLAAAKFHLSRVGSGSTRPEQSQEIVTQVKQMLKEAIEKSRDLSHELSPAVLRHGDLAETLDWLAEQMQAQHGLTVQVETFGAVKTQSDVVSALVYRAAQELLFNVVKHARVLEACLRLRRLGRYICLSVSDRGRGFDPQEVKETAGFGLLNIRERVALLGGRMKIRSARGRGTTFHIIVPDAKSSPDDAAPEGEAKSRPERQNTPE